MGKVINFLDKLEDKVRANLSRRPILYAFIGGTSIVLFWRGVWMVADMFPFLTGPVSILISATVLLSTGLFVSFFIGDAIILSGLKREKRQDEKVASELKTETELLNSVQKSLNNIEKQLRGIRRTMKEDSASRDHIKKIKT